MVGVGRWFVLRGYRRKGALSYGSFWSRWERELGAKLELDWMGLDAVVDKLFE